MTDGGAGGSDGSGETGETEPLPLVHEVPRALSPLVRRIVAGNPSHMTGAGTNTYLVGVDEIAVIDPGPDDPAHLEAILGCGGDRIRWILCTHTHPDHSPGAAALKAATGARVLAWSSRNGLRVDQRIGDGFRLTSTEFHITAVHTPGHASNHLCYLLEEERLLFTGDHIMQGSTVVISPPDGDMGAYLESLAKVRSLRARAIAPGHGHLIEDPDSIIDWYTAHRLEREAQLHDLLVGMGSARVRELVDSAYEGLDPVLVPMARRSVHAHLRKMRDEGRVAGTHARGVWTATAN